MSLVAPFSDIRIKWGEKPVFYVSLPVFLHMKEKPSYGENTLPEDPVPGWVRHNNHTPDDKLVGDGMIQLQPALIFVEKVKWCKTFKVLMRAS